MAIDHTYDADQVEFPDGRVETFAMTGDIDDALIAKALAVRTADTRLVLNQLTAQRRTQHRRRTATPATRRPKF